MNSTALLAKAIRPAIRTVAVRSVSDIRIQPKTFVYRGKTYTQMVYPHTLAARLVMYPWKLDFTSSWFTRYLIYAFILSYPLWIFIHNKVNSPEAKAAWAAKKHEEHVKANKQPWEI